MAEQSTASRQSCHDDDASVVRGASLQSVAHCSPLDKVPFIKQPLPPILLATVGSGSTSGRRPAVLMVKTATTTTTTSTTMAAVANVRLGWSSPHGTLRKDGASFGASYGASFGASYGVSLQDPLLGLRVTLPR